eukprot:jgi/Orpsp1_1/1177551/evm.model.c7180000061879.1
MVIILLHLLMELLFVKIVGVQSMINTIWIEKNLVLMSLSEPTSYDFSLVELTEKDRNINPVIDQHDLLPAYNGWNAYSMKKVVAMSNVFTPGRDELLESISTYVFVPNTMVEYDVFKLNFNHTDPTDGTLVASGSKNIVYAGFHLFELDTPIEIKGTESYSIVIRQKDKENNYYYGFTKNRSKEYFDAYNEAVTDEDDKREYYSVAIVNKGESFLYSDGVWTDETILIPDFSKYNGPHPSQNNSRLIVENGYVVDNYPIKGYAVINKPINITNTTISVELEPTEIITTTVSVEPEPTIKIITTTVNVEPEPTETIIDINSDENSSNSETEFKGFQKF